MIEVWIHYEEDGEDRELQAELLAVPRVGEHISVGSMSADKMQRFEVMNVWHSHLDDESRADLFCRKLAKRESPPLFKRSAFDVL